MATIEDIAELQRVGTKETYILFVDSEKRDKSVWNNQSEYDIEFASPFRNVYGIDILDLAIPRTEYIIDTFDNVLTFQIDTEPIQQLAIAPGDYAIEQLIQVLNESLVANNKSIFVSGVTDPISIQGKLSFTSNYPFNFNMSKSSIRNVLGFNNPILAMNNPDIGVNYNIPVAYVDGVSDDIFYSVLDTSQIVVQNTYTGPNPVLNSIPLTTTSHVRQQFIASATGNVEVVTAAFGLVGNSIPTNNTVQWSVIDGSNVVYASGNINVIVDQFDSYSATTVGSFNTFNPLLYGTSYYLTFTSTLTDAGNCYGLFYSLGNFPNPNTNNNNDISISTNGSTWSNAYPTFDTCSTVDIGGYSNMIVPPGVYDMVGQRYLLIRMPEIEDHLFGARVSETHNLGMAKVQLGNYGYSTSTFSWNGLPPRTFQPIGKLPKIHVRFTRPTGDLYDFKNVPHNFTMAVHYYTVPNVVDVGVSRFNPNYTPDVMKFLTDKWQKENDEDDRTPCYK